MVYEVKSANVYWQTFYGASKSLVRSEKQGACTFLSHRSFLISQLNCPSRSPPGCRLLPLGALQLRMWPAYSSACHRRCSPVGRQLYCQLLSEKVFVHEQRGFTPTPGLPFHKLGFFQPELSG